jgi:hypothetical protein
MRRRYVLFPPLHAPVLPLLPELRLRLLLSEEEASSGGLWVLVWFRVERLMLPKRRLMSGRDFVGLDDEAEVCALCEEREWEDLDLEDGVMIDTF